MIDISTAVNPDGWNLRMRNNTFATTETRQLGAAAYAGWDHFAAGSSASSFKSHAYLVVGDPAWDGAGIGTSLNDECWLELFYGLPITGTLVSDVELDDATSNVDPKNNGNNNGAPSGASTLPTNESVRRKHPGGLYQVSTTTPPEPSRNDWIRSTVASTIAADNPTP